MYDAPQGGMTILFCFPAAASPSSRAMSSLLRSLDAFTDPSMFCLMRPSLSERVTTTMSFATAGATHRQTTGSHISSQRIARGIKTEDERERTQPPQKYLCTTDPLLPRNLLHILILDQRAPITSERTVRLRHDSFLFAIRNQREIRVVDVQFELVGGGDGRDVREEGGEGGDREVGDADGADFA